MRRNDREVSELTDILAILDKCEVMRIGLCDGNKPYVVPLNFAYEEVDGKVSVYFHCAREGRKLDIIARNNYICFEADCSYKTIRAETACGWSAEYESVIGEGIAAVLTDATQKIAALDLLMARHGFEGKPCYSPQALAAVAVVQISAETISGKRRI